MQLKRMALLVKSIASQDAKKTQWFSHILRKLQVPFVRQQVLCLASIAACAVPPVIVPEPFHCQLGNPIMSISVTEIVEQCKFVPIQHVAIRRTLYSPPQILNGSLEYPGRFSINRIRLAVTGTLQCLADAATICRSCRIGHLSLLRVMFLRYLERCLGLFARGRFEGNTHAGR